MKAVTITQKKYNLKNINEYGIDAIEDKKLKVNHIWPKFQHTLVRKTVNIFWNIQYI